MHKASHAHVRSLGSDWLRHRATFEKNEHVHSFLNVAAASNRIDAAIVIHPLVACMVQAAKAASKPVSLTSRSRGGRTADVSSEVFVAEAKKADGASKSKRTVQSREGARSLSGAHGSTP